MSQVDKAAFASEDSIRTMMDQMEAMYTARFGIYVFFPEGGHIFTATCFSPWGQKEGVNAASIWSPA
jgi:hypothetical protein